MNKELRRIKIFDIPISVITREEAVEEFLRCCVETPNLGVSTFTATPNAEILLEAENNPKLKKYLQQCELNLADSVSLLWAAECQAHDWSFVRAIFELIFLPIRKSSWTALPERVSGSDFFLDICEATTKAPFDKGGGSKSRGILSTNLKIFLLGGAEGIAQKTKEILEQKYTNINIVETLAGSPMEADDADMISAINKAQPDILFIAYGCPKQELWIARNLSKCPSVKVAMGIGGTFDFVSGQIKRAPKTFQKIGLEWLWRLVLQPSRLKRIFRAVFVFPFVFLKNRYKQKVRSQKLIKYLTK